MKNSRLVLFLLFCTAVSTAASKELPIRFLVCVSQWKPESGNLTLHVIWANTSSVRQDLSKAGKINLTCKIGVPAVNVPGRYIGITRSLEPELAALKLKSGQWVSQEIQLRPGLGAGMAAEISATCESAGVTHKSNTIYLKKGAR